MRADPAGEPASYIEPSYLDSRGVRREASPELVRDLEASLGGFDPGSGDGEDTILFVETGRGRDVPGAVKLVLEYGEERTVKGRVPRDVPSGYHDLELERPNRRVPLVVHPPKCFLPADLSVWGFAVQLYALRSRRSWGMGDLGDLRSVAEFSRSLGAGILLVNPLDACAPTLPQQSSPYSPTSRLYDSPLYLRVEAVPGARALGSSLEPLVRAGKALNASRWIERDPIFELKMRALERIFAGFRGARGFDRYLAREGEMLARFATFSAISEKHGPNFHAWPATYQDCRSTAVEQFRRDHAARIRFHQWLQWSLSEQLARATEKLRILRDLPIGVDPGGADVWMFPGAFAPAASVGAPPDDFNPTGQDWGLAPLVPWRLSRSRFEPFIRTVRAALRGAGGLRVDHVMGLFHLYLVPKGHDAASGGYVRYPWKELLGILALESERSKAFIVGEDLGTVVEAYRRELRERRVLSYRVAWFEDRPPRTYPKDSLAAMTTHDLPTIAGVLSGFDRDEQRALGMIAGDGAQAVFERRLEALSGLPVDAGPARIVERCHAALSRAKSRVVLAGLEDAIASPARPNMPGISGPPSFCRPLDVTLEELVRHPLPKKVARALGAGGRVTRRSRRSPRRG